MSLSSTSNWIFAGDIFRRLIRYGGQRLKTEDQYLILKDTKLSLVDRHGDFPARQREVAASLRSSIFGPGTWRHSVGAQIACWWRTQNGCRE